MADLHFEADWSLWIICVHNCLGKAVATVAFPSVVPVEVPLMLPRANGGRPTLLQH